MPSNLISVIVPCYNVEKYLDKSLKSVYEQDYTNWECIIINDGSIDNSSKIAEKWVNLDGRFKYYYQENQGLSEARNTGIKKAKGDFIYFFDSDDLIAPYTLYNLHKLVKPEIDIVVGLNAITEGQSDLEKGLMSHTPEKLTSIFNKNKSLLNLVITQPLICVAWNKLYRKEFINEHELYFKKGIYHEDELWFFETLFHANAIILNNTPTYFYNVANVNSITNNFNIRNLESYLLIIETLYNKYYLTNKEHKNTIATYITYLQYLTIVHCYAKLPTEIKKEAEVKIHTVFDKILFHNFEPTLDKKRNNIYKEFQSISFLKANTLLKFFRYSRSKKLTRRLKKKILIFLNKRK